MAAKQTGWFAFSPKSKKQQETKQQKDFQEHIQRQNESNTRFNTQLDVAGNFLMGIIQSSQAKRTAIAESFALSFVEKINSARSSVPYYRYKEREDGYPGNNYKADYGKLFNNKYSLLKIY